MVEGFQFVDPRGLEFLAWARLLAESLAQYNVPSPVSEGLWQVWAANLLAVPAVEALGVPDPRAYSDWRLWAFAFSQVT